MRRTLIAKCILAAGCIVAGLMGCTRAVPMGEACPPWMPDCDAGGRGGTGGDAGTGGTSLAPLRAYVLNDGGTPVDRVWIARGACAQLTAAAEGGNPDYQFTWDDGSTDATRSVCPSASTRLRVTVNDTPRTMGGFTYPGRTVETEVDVDVGYCKAGRFEGPVYLASYYPNAAGVCGIASVWGGMDIHSTLAFSLGNVAADGSTLSVVPAESCLELTIPRPMDAGTPNPMGDAGATQDAPLRLAFSGSVDCDTGVLRGEVRGAYYSVSVCTLGMFAAWYSVKGTLEASYDPASRAFTGGVMDLQEPPGLLDALGIGLRPGGVGTWGATLDPDAGPTTPVADCLDGAPWMDFDLVPR